MGRHAKNLGTRGDVVENPRSAPNLDPVAQGAMAVDSNLTRHDDPLAQVSGSGKAHLTKDQAVVSDLNVVCHVHKVVELDPVPHARSPDPCTVHRTVGADVHAIAKFHDTTLGYGLPALGSGVIAKASTA
jgi:hypothetical protein